MDLLVGEVSVSDDLDAIKVGALSEVGNIVLNAVMASFGDMLDARLTYSIPVYMEGKISSVFIEEATCHSPILSATAKFTVEEQQIFGEIILLFEIGAFDVLSTAVLNQLECEAF